jgi:uncharacterized metal-binding protein YceD (DUF177 family)
MRIPMDKIHKPGLKLTADHTDDWVNTATRSVRGTPGEPTQDPHEEEGALSASIAFMVRRRDEQLQVEGSVNVVLLCACDRCGTSLQLSIAGDIDQLYKPPDDKETKLDHDLESGDLDMGWHDGKALDLEMVLSEALALLGPDRVFCEDENVSRISEDGPCELPTNALEGGPSRANPFAALLDLE